MLRLQLVLDLLPFPFSILEEDSGFQVVAKIEEKYIQKNMLNWRVKQAFELPSYAL